MIEKMNNCIRFTCDNGRIIRLFNCNVASVEYKGREVERSKVGADSFADLLHSISMLPPED